MIISSFFTLDSIPAVGLSPLPTLLIWEVDGTSETLVIPSASMSEVGDGFYQYLFSSYVDGTQYVFRVDGGTTYALDNAERYQAGSIEVATLTDAEVADISASVWNSVAVNFTTPGTMGLLENQTNANTLAIANNLFMGANNVLDLVQLLVQYETNRTRIDPIARTLTVYENDCVTPLRVFSLLDTTGSPSITEVAERKPISANDGQPVC